MKAAIFAQHNWLNEASARLEDDKVIMHTPAKTDFFCQSSGVGEEGITPESLTNAPFLYREVTGDFVLKVKVSHDFKDIYDAAAIMVMKDLHVWAKACFEFTDFHTKAVVSVVTNQISDDANGCNIENSYVWLQATRVGNSFAFHYSLDGVKFDMMRFFSLPVEDTIKVGLVSQAPIGGGGERMYEEYSLENKTVKNIRTGQ